jgi:glutamyl-tRNA synthetase
MAQVITRFPPSPTGFLHIGSVRTALFNHLFAAHNGGEMLLRFEDTDRERSKQEFEQDILEALAWLGIPYTSASPLRQSERGEIYKKHFAKLLQEGSVYEAEDAKDGSGKKIIRFKNPNRTVAFHDAVRGDVSFDTTELGDFVIARGMDEPLYHLAVVIDDHEMGVTHVIRGEDHISNTPRQILLLEALGFDRPEYAHIPLILAPDKSKLSKRHGAVSVNEYRAQGYIPEGLLNYLALLGWNPGGEQEVFSMGELAKLFTLDRVHKAGAVFGTEKLKWFNHEHLKRLDDAEYAARLKAFSNRDIDARLVPLLKERAQTLAEATEMLDTEFAFFGGVDPGPEILTQDGKITAEVASVHLKALLDLLEPIPDEGFTAAQLKDIIWPYATAEGRGAVLWPLRTALSGRDKSPDPFIIASLIGKAETLKRIASALKKL